MRNLNRMRVAVIALTIAVGAAVPIAMAQSGEQQRKDEHQSHWRGREGFRGGADAGRMFSQLDLTDAQKAQLKQIRESQRQTLQPLMKDIRAKRQEIRQATANGSFDEALVRQKLIEIAPLEAKLMGEQFRIRQQMSSILTPDQKSKLEQLREQYKNRSTERGARKEQKTL